MTYDLSQQLALFEDLDVGTSHHHAHTHYPTENKL